MRLFLLASGIGFMSMIAAAPAGAADGHTTAVQDENGSSVITQSGDPAQAEVRIEKEPGRTAVYRRSGNTRVSGVDAEGMPIRFDSGTSRSFVLAPAIEYNITANVGVLFGVRTVVAGRNTSAHVTPAIAVNIVR